MRFGRRSLGSPSPGQAISPLVGSSSFAMIASKVDFPLPDGPTTAICSPRDISPETSSSAKEWPSRKRKRRDSAPICTMTSAIDDPAVLHRGDSSCHAAYDGVVRGDNDSPAVLAEVGEQRKDGFLGV